jgi:hypothetical protein
MSLKLWITSCNTVEISKINPSTKVYIIKPITNIKIIGYVFWFFKSQRANISGRNLLKFNWYQYQIADWCCIDGSKPRIKVKHQLWTCNEVLKNIIKRSEHHCYRLLFYWINWSSKFATDLNYRFEIRISCRYIQYTFVRDLVIIISFSIYFIRFTNRDCSIFKLFSFTKTALGSFGSCVICFDGLTDNCGL